MAEPDGAQAMVDAYGDVMRHWPTREQLEGGIQRFAEMLRNPTGNVLSTSSAKPRIVRKRRGCLVFENLG